jgi:N6-adenosine-specific RNA methylase IME4
MGMGVYVRWYTEFVVFGVRGKLPTLRNNALGIVFAERRQHSEKPEEMYELVRSLSPGPRIDIFARRERPGFIAWGDEVTSG